MSGLAQAEHGDNSARWVDSTMTINTTNCTMSFFQPVIDETLRKEASHTPDGPLPLVEETIKDEPSEPTTPHPATHNLLSEGHEVDFVLYPPQPEDENEEWHTSDLVKEEHDETENFPDKIPPPNGLGRATGQVRMNSGIAQLEQFADGQDAPHTATGNLTPPRQQPHDRPDAVEIEDEDLASDEEDLASLLERFAVKRGAPSSSSSSATPSRKRKRHCDPFTTPDRSSLSSPTHFREKLAPMSEANFYRQQADQLPRPQKRAKSHDWTFQQREALCLIPMFYEVDAGFAGIAKILNEHFQLPPGRSFRPVQINSQWQFWRYLFRKRPAYDPKSEWLDKRAAYEAAASRAAVELKPRAVQLKGKRLSPKFQKTAERVATQDVWFLGQLLRLRDARKVPPTSPNDSPLADRSSTGDDSILLQLLEAAEPESPSPSKGTSPAHTPSQGPTSSQESAPNAPVEEDDDTDDPPTPYRPAQASAGYAPASTPQTKRDEPALLYRVYHDASGGLNTPTRFRAGLFNIPGQSMAPPPSDAAILPVFVSWHLWHHTLSSPFVSCTDSLIMALHKARRAEAAGLRPHVAVIDARRLAAASFPAAPLVAEARRRGLVPGMRYRGLRERLVWGEIAGAAVVRDLPLRALRSLTARDLGVADLLALDDVDPAPRMSVARVRAALLRQEVVLDGWCAGHAVGRLAALFGLGSLPAPPPPPVVAQFVYDVFQGWALGAAGVREMAGGFVVGLADAEEGAGGAVVVLDEGEEGRLKEAFVGGVERAQEDLRGERRSVRK